MKVLVFATLVVIAFLQLAWGKTLQSLFMNKRSLGARQVPDVPDLPDIGDLDLGTCDAGDLQQALSDYPVAECGALDITGLLGTTNICTERCGRPILDFFERCGLDTLTENLVYTCSMNAAGGTCGAMLTNTLTLATAAASTCLPGSESCSDACQSDLQALRSAAGCCGNFTQAPSVFSANIMISDFNLWNTCNVTVTGVCTEGAFNSGKGLIVTKITFLGLAVLAMVTMLL